MLAKLIDGLESFPALVEVARVSMAGDLVLQNGRIRRNTGN